MQIKIVTLDVRLSENTKRAIRWVLLPVAVLAGSMAVARAYTTTWIASGAQLSATTLKSNLDEIQTRLVALEGQVHPASGFHAWVTTFPQIAGGENQVVFNNVEFDLNSEYNAGNGEFIPKNAGTYLVHCGVELQTTGGTVAVGIYKNSAEVVAAETPNFSGGASPEAIIVMKLAVGDIVACSVYQNSGASVTLSHGTSYPARNTFSAARLY